MGWGTLEATLAFVVRADGQGVMTWASPVDTADWTALAIRAFWAGDFDAVHDAAVGAHASADSDLDSALAAAAAGLAVAGGTEQPDTEPWTRVHTPLTAGDDAQRAFAQYLLAESALVSARLDLASAFAADGGAWERRWLDSPFSAVMLGCRVRIAAFAGRIDDAAALLPELDALAQRHGLDELAAAVTSLVTGNADDAERTRADVARMLESSSPAHDYLGRGVRLLAAFGAVALGDLDDAASLVLAAGGDPGLGRLTIIDRALGFELLAAAAIAADDTEAALAWCAQLELMAASAIAAPTLDRTRARIALHTGDPHAAVRLAAQAAQSARAQGRAVEAAEGEVVLARARIAADQVAHAARSLRAMVTEADAAGHRAARRSATQILAQARRRLPPPRGSGWDALSPREIEVAGLIARGEDSADIARALFLSRATVRVHTSRVLAAFGVPTCTALIAVLAPTLPPVGAPALLPALSPRRAQVVELVARGWGNARIADALGISVKVVERHVGDALRLWGVHGRAQLASLWWAAEQAS